MVTESQIKEKLKEIIDPELDRDIVTLGFVKEIVIDDGRVLVKIQLTFSGCPLRFIFYQQIQEKLRTFKEIKEVEVEFL